MRVIAGSAKGRILRAVPGQITRPITDRVKESLFNIVGPELQGARFLDLYAGTGAVGIEALSRGAEAATFVERNREVLAVLRRNLEETGLSDRARVVPVDVLRFLEGAEEPFEMVFLAPPQYRDLWWQTLQSVERSAVLGEATLVIAQMHPREWREPPLERLALVDRRRYGSTLLAFYELVPGTLG